MASNAAAGRQRAAEARKRKKTEQTALEGIVAAINSQEAKDQDFVVEATKQRPNLASLLAGMIRDGRFEAAQQKIQEGPDNKPATDLGRPLGKTVRTFKKLGISFLPAFLTKLAGDDTTTKDKLLALTKPKMVGDTERPLTADEVGEIWHFLLDVNDTSIVPTSHSGSGFANPLLAVLQARYVDCGQRLSPLISGSGPIKPICWTFNPESEHEANKVTFQLGSAVLKVDMPLTIEDVRSTDDWKLEAPHTFYSHLSAPSKCLSIPLGEKLEALYPTECGALPMFDPCEKFEYPGAWAGASEAAPATPSSSVPSSAGQVPIAGPGVMAALEQGST